MLGYRVLNAECLKFIIKAIISNSKEDIPLSEKPIELVIENYVSIREKVYAYLRDKILSGEIPPMTRMLESEWAKRIGVSRTPVREAFHVMEKEGLLESIPRVGYRVKQIAWEEVEEICEIRIATEILMAEWALRRMTPFFLQALQENLTRSEAEVREGHPELFVERDAEFHEILARASASQRLLELNQMLRRHMLRYRIEGLYRQEPALGGIAGHRRILDRMIAKDSVGTARAVRQHIKESKKAIQQYAFEEKAKSKEGNGRVCREGA